MRLNKANIAGLAPRQQSEMKSILAGTWPPLKPLPVFKYETVEYRATIDFDRKRGEWVCRKISLPSNEVQELRGGLREITMALPHGEAEMFIEVAGHQEQELDKDRNRRLQAIRDWRENYENGARYFELRDYLSESQRTELDDSLRLTLTARQLQFNAKNVANVFDDLSIAGGRFATLIELAKRDKAKQGTDPQPQAEGVAPEAEGAIDHDESPLGIKLPASSESPPEFGPVLKNIETNNENRFVPDQEAAERCADVEEFPAVTIKDVFPEPDQASLAERTAHTAAQQFEIETSEIVDVDSSSLAEEFPAVTIKDVFPEPDQASLAERTAHTAARQFETENSEIVDSDVDAPSLVEHPHQEGPHSPAFTGFAAPDRTGRWSADRIAGSFLSFPRLEISGFQVGIVALLFLSAVIAFVVGLKAGRDALGGRLQEPPKPMLVSDAKPPTLPDQAHESTSQTPAPSVASSDDSVGAKRLDNATSSGEKSKESPTSSNLAEVGPTVSDSPPATESKPSFRPEESKPSIKPEVNSEHSGSEHRDVIGPVVRNVSPPPSPKLAHPPKTVRRISSAPRRPARYKLSSTIGAAPHVPRPPTVLVTVPDRGQPFRVNFPKKAIAATSSLAMASQLSVLVSPESGPTVAHKPARLEAGELVTFVWPRYPRPGNGLAETIRVRANIGQLGQVLEVKFLSGSVSLLPATTGAIRQWRYRPTLLDKKPVQAQQDVTIEFRPPQYSSQVSTPHSSHN